MDSKTTKRAFRITCRILLCCMVLLILFAVGKVSYEFGHKIFEDKAVVEKPGIDISIEIQNEDSLKRVAEKLKANNLIENEFIFQIRTKIFGYEKKIKAGTYLLNSSWKTRQILAVLAGEE